MSWRWEVGAPLVGIGLLLAVLALGARGAGVVFWLGTALVAAGVAAIMRGD